MFDDRNFSWGSALVGAAAATAATLVISSRPRKSTSHLISVDLTSFKINFPTLDAHLNLTVNVTNPNAAPVVSGSRLGSEPQRSRQLLRLPVIRLSGSQLADVAKRFVGEVGRRKMVLNSTLSVDGAARVMWWNQKFKVQLDSHVNMDPSSLALGLLRDHENRSKLKILIKS